MIASNSQAGIFRRIEALNQTLGLAVKSLHIGRTTHPPAANEAVRPGDQTSAEEAAILHALRQGGYDLIVLMGYLKRVGQKVVHEFGWRPEYTSPYQARLVNTHPGLLPATKGLYGRHVQEHVLALGLPHGGQTLHVVAEAYDDGPVIAEHQVPVRPGDTPDRLFDRVKQAEKAYLPYDIAAFIEARRRYLRAEER